MNVKTKIKYIVCILIFLLFVCLGISFASELETRSSPNYLVLLVHGMGARGAAFGHGDADDHAWDDKNNGEDEPYGDLQYFLRHDLGMEGYVYAYSFADKNASSIIHAQELGDRQYYIQNPSAARYTDISRRYTIKESPDSKVETTKCMLDQAKEDFKDDYYRIHGRNPTDWRILLPASPAV